MVQIKKALFRLVALCLAGAAAGCGGGKGDVSGTVNYKGKALSYGRISFVSESGKHEVFASLIRNGKYSVAGVPAGEAKVTVETFKPQSTIAVLKPPGKRSAEEMMGPGLKVAKAGEGDPVPPPPKGARYQQVPMKYASPDQSPLTYTVIKGPQTKDFNLD